MSNIKYLKQHGQSVNPIRIMERDLPKWQDYVVVKKDGQWVKKGTEGVVTDFRREVFSHEIADECNNQNLDDLNTRVNDYSKQSMIQSSGIEKESQTQTNKKPSADEVSQEQQHSVSLPPSTQTREFEDAVGSDDQDSPNDMPQYRQHLQGKKVFFLPTVFPSVDKETGELWYNRYLKANGLVRDFGGEVVMKPSYDYAVACCHRGVEINRDLVEFLHYKYFEDLATMDSTGQNLDIQRYVFTMKNCAYRNKFHAISNSADFEDFEPEETNPQLKKAQRSAQIQHNTSRYVVQETYVPRDPPHPRHDPQRTPRNIGDQNAQVVSLQGRQSTNQNEIIVRTEILPLLNNRIIFFDQLDTESWDDSEKVEILQKAKRIAAEVFKVIPEPATKFDPDVHLAGATELNPVFVVCCEPPFDCRFWAFYCSLYPHLIVLHYYFFIDFEKVFQKLISKNEIVDYVANNPLQDMRCFFRKYQYTCSNYWLGPNRRKGETKSWSLKRLEDKLFYWQNRLNNNVTISSNAEAQRFYNDPYLPSDQKYHGTLPKREDSYTFFIPKMAPPYKAHPN